MSVDRYNESVRLIANGYNEEFAEFCARAEKMHELMLDLASEFVAQNIPVVSEDSQNDLATELQLSITITTV